MTFVRRNVGLNHYYVDVLDQPVTGPDGVEITEVKVPGVTTILSDAVPKSGLVSWAAKEAASYAVEHWDELAGEKLLTRADRIATAWRGERDAASGRGQLIHKLAERLQRGDQVDIPDGLEGHVESCVRFLDQYDVEPILAEFAVVNRSVGYAGTGDLLCDMLRHRWLLDWKTGKSVYAETALQLAAYRYAEHYLDERKVEQPMEPLGIERAAVVHLRADGFDLIPMRADENTFKLFRHLAYISRWLHRTQDGRGQWGSRLDALMLPAMQPARTPTGVAL